MSSPEVRKAIMDKIKVDFPALDSHDLSDYISINDLPTNLTGVTLLVQFLGGTEDMVNIAGEGNQGWMENGSIVLHYLIPTGFDFRSYLAEMENIRLSLRGKRLADSVVVQSATPFSDQLSIRVDGGWHGWASNLYFTRHLCG